MRFNFRRIFIFSTTQQKFYYITMLLCICVFLFSLFKIATKVYAYYYDNKQYEEIREQVENIGSEDLFNDIFETSPAPTKPPETTSETEASQESSPAPTEPQPTPVPTPTIPYLTANGDKAHLDENGVLSDFTKYISINRDIVGWINIPGYENIPGQSKEISYPIMQTEDNDFYLYRDFYKNNSQAGSIYMDYRNTSLVPDRHMILYGHAMKDKSMFGNLQYFPDKPEEYTKNTIIYVDLLNVRMEYEIFSIYYVDAKVNYRQTFFGSDSSYMNFLNKLKDSSVHDFNISLTPLDKILTLSTCNNDLGHDTRSVVHARLVRQIVYDADSDTGETVHIESDDKRIWLANVYLEEFSLSYEKDGEEITPKMNPEFNTSIKEFDINVPYYAEEITINVVTADPKARIIEVKLNDEEINVKTMNLIEGENKIEVLIISRDGAFLRYYRMFVDREKSPLPTETPVPVETTTAVEETTASEEETTASEDETTGSEEETTIDEVEETTSEDETTSEEETETGE